MVALEDHDHTGFAHGAAQAHERFALSGVGVLEFEIWGLVADAEAHGVWTALGFKMPWFASQQEDGGGGGGATDHNHSPDHDPQQVGTTAWGAFFNR